MHRIVIDSKRYWIKRLSHNACALHEGQILIEGMFFLKRSFSMIRASPFLTFTFMEVVQISYIFHLWRRQYDRWTNRQSWILSILTLKELSNLLATGITNNCLFVFMHADNMCIQTQLWFAHFTALFAFQWILNKKRIVSWFITLISTSDYAPLWPLGAL